MDVKHIYWFAYYDLREPSVRYRGQYPLEMLQNDFGITSDLVVPNYSVRNILHFFRVYLEVLFFRKKNSMIMFQGIFSRRFYARALKLLIFFRRKNTVFDIDDANYSRFPPETIHFFMNKCSVVTVGSQALFEYAKKNNPEIRMLTSPVIPHAFRKAKRNDKFTIGWIGYYNAHKESLQELFFPALDKINIKVRLVLLGVVRPQQREDVLAHFKDHPFVELEMPDNINWYDEESIYERISKFDVGVSPMLNTELNRAKSAFKLKQYHSSGVPVLASTIGENIVFLEEGKNGFFCDNPDEYLEKITEFQSMHVEKYHSFCRNSRNNFSTFSLDNYSFTLKNIFHP